MSFSIFDAIARVSAYIVEIQNQNSELRVENSRLKADCLQFESQLQKVTQDLRTATNRANALSTRLNLNPPRALTRTMSVPSKPPTALPSNTKVEKPQPQKGPVQNSKPKINTAAKAPVAPVTVTKSVIPTEELEGISFDFPSSIPLKIAYCFEAHGRGQPHVRMALHFQDTCPPSVKSEFGYMLIKGPVEVKKWNTEWEIEGDDDMPPLI